VFRTRGSDLILALLSSEFANFNKTWVRKRSVLSRFCLIGLTEYGFK